MVDMETQSRLNNWRLVGLPGGAKGPDPCSFLEAWMPDTPIPPASSHRDRESVLNRAETREERQRCATENFDYKVPQLQTENGCDKGSYCKERHLLQEPTGSILQRPCHWSAQTTQTIQPSAPVGEKPSNRKQQKAEGASHLVGIMGLFVCHGSICLMYVIMFSCVNALRHFVYCFLFRSRELHTILNATKNRAWIYILKFQWLTEN